VIKTPLQGELESLQAELQRCLTVPHPACAAWPLLRVQAYKEALSELRGRRYLLEPVERDAPDWVLNRRITALQYAIRRLN
jgi:hypothetical protein